MQFNLTILFNFLYIFPNYTLKFTKCLLLTFEYFCYYEWVVDIYANLYLEIIEIMYV